MEDHKDFLIRVLSDCMPELSSISDLETRADSLINRLFDQLDKKHIVPSNGLMESLRKLEPLMGSLGKKGHYLHMFNCLLLGDVILDRLFRGKAPDYVKALWLLIAASHDVAYPVELAEDEMRSFFEKYFAVADYPRVQLDKGSLLSFGAFPRYRRRIRSLARGVLDISPYSGEDHLLEQLILYNLATRLDHAVVSAFLLMDSIDCCREFTVVMGDYGVVLGTQGIEVGAGGATARGDAAARKSEGADNPVLRAFLDVAGTVVLMHNFHHWRFHAIDATERAKSENEKGKLKDPLVLHLLTASSGRRQLPTASDGRNQPSEELGAFVETQRALLLGMKVGAVKLGEIPRDLAKLAYPPIQDDSKGRIAVARLLTLLLSVVDTIQEWGRETTDRGMPKPLAVLGVKAVEAGGGNQTDTVTVELRIPGMEVIDLEPLSRKPAEPAKASHLRRGGMSGSEKETVWSRASRIVPGQDHEETAESVITKTPKRLSARALKKVKDEAAETASKLRKSADSHEACEGSPGSQGASKVATGQDAQEELRGKYSGLRMIVNLLELEESVGMAFSPADKGHVRIEVAYANAVNLLVTPTQVCRVQVPCITQSCS